MAITYKTLVPSKYVESVTVSQYQPINMRAIIDKLTITNVTASPATITIYITNAGGAAGADNEVIPPRVINPSETAVITELSGHVLSDKDALYTLAGTASALVIRMSGREIV